MRQELIYGLAIAFFWGIYAVILKVATRNVPLKDINLFLALGILLASIISYILLKGKFVLNKYSLLAFLSGILWFIGILLLDIALKKGQKLSILAPIFNTNTLIVVLLSVLFLRERVCLWKVLLASILIMIGVSLLV